jgi:putative transcriptional regulator
MENAFDSIKTGLEEAIEYAKGKRHKKTRIHKIKKIDVKKIRKKVGMSQTQFAASFGISLGTLRHWERGDRTPRGPARILLKVVNHSPDTVLKITNNKI